ncbi:MAG: glycosyltransferase family 2 protein, partial [Rikenellaceae bacterium]
MKISIITSCFNRESTIREAIESVLMQDYADIEYIVVDGASKDNSLSIISEYKNKISKIISEPDHGMYEAINKGMRAATGDMIGLVHSDDFLYSNNTVSKIVEHIESHNADILYGDGLFVDCNNTSKIVRNWISGKYKKRNFRNGWLPLHPTVYISKECFDTMGLYNENFKIAADTDLLVRYMYEGDYNVTYLNDYIVKMRMGGLSTDPKRMRQKWSEDMRLPRTFCSG